MKNKAKKFIRDIMAIVQQPEMMILPGQLAFFFVLSIIPIFAVIVIITSALSLSSDSVLTFLSNILPKGVTSSLVSVLNYSNIDMNILLFLIMTFILASNGASSIINASNTIYKIKPSPWLNRKIKAILLTFSIVFVLLFTLLVPTFGFKIIHYIKSIDILSGFDTIVEPLFNLCAVPISILVIYFNLKLIYVLSPDKKIKSSSVTNGALFTTFGWIISSRIFSYYVIHFSKYNLVYGSLTNIIILMLWFYILSYIFVIGMSLNVINEKEKV